MTGTITIPDPTAALMLTALKSDDLGRIYRSRRELRRRRQRFEHAARLRRLLA